MWLITVFYLCTWLFTSQDIVWNRTWTIFYHMSRRTTKPTKWTVRPAKAQISLGIRPVWLDSSLSAWRIIGPLTTYGAHSEDSDQTGQMPRLIRVFAGHTSHFVVFVMQRLILIYAYIIDQYNCAFLWSPLFYRDFIIFNSQMTGSEWQFNWCLLYQQTMIFLIFQIKSSDCSKSVKSHPWITEKHILEQTFSGFLLQHFSKVIYLQQIC